MSESPAAVEDMARKDLEDEVEALREHTRRLDDRIGELDRKNALVIASVRALVSSADVEVGEDDDPLVAMRQAATQVSGDFEDVQTAVSAHGEQLSAIADVGGKKTSKDEKVTAIATFAMRKSDANSYEGTRRRWRDGLLRLDDARGRVTA